MSRFLARAEFRPLARFESAGAPAAFGKLSVLFRGYVAQRAALRAELRDVRGAGDDDSASDAALVALAYTRFGDEFARHVSGEYAAAVWDASRERLILAHDELGLMPLFYALEERAIVFASHLDELVREIGTGDLDEEYVADHLGRGEHTGTRTPYASVKRLAPGESFVWARDACGLRDVWTLDAIEPLTLRDDAEYAERLRDAIVQSVADATEPGRRVWCEVSGGLDSSTVFGVAHGELGLAADALSFVFPRSKTADERPWIHAVLRKHPATWHTIDADSARPFAEIASDVAGEPTRWQINAGWNRLYGELLAEHGVDIVLTGEGGDAALFGDEQAPLYLADHLLRGRLGSLWRDARAWSEQSETGRSTTHQLLNFALVPAVRSLRGRALEFRPAEIPWAEPGFARRTQLSERGRAPWLPKARTVEDGYMLQRVIRSAGLVSTLFQSRHLTAAVRNPLLARRVVAFMLSLPSAQRMRPGRTRVLHRLATAGILPEVTRERAGKGGSSQPACDGLERSESAVSLLAGRPRIVERGYANIVAWRDAIEQVRMGRLAALHLFEAWAALEFWLQSLERVPTRGARRLSGGASPEPYEERAHFPRFTER